MVPLQRDHFEKREKTARKTPKNVKKRLEKRRKT
jgi:hypothetical protein